MSKCGGNSKPPSEYSWANKYTHCKPLSLIAPCLAASYPGLDGYSMKRRGRPWPVQQPIHHNLSRLFAHSSGRPNPNTVATTSGHRQCIERTGSLSILTAASSLPFTFLGTHHPHTPPVPRPYPKLPWQGTKGERRPITSLNRYHSIFLAQLTTNNVLAQLMWRCLPRLASQLFIMRASVQDYNEQMKKKQVPIYINE